MLQRAGRSSPGEAAPTPVRAGSTPRPARPRARAIRLAPATGRPSRQAAAAMIVPPADRRRGAPPRRAPARRLLIERRRGAAQERRATQRDASGIEQLGGLPDSGGQGAVARRAITSARRSSAKPAASRPRAGPAKLREELEPRGSAARLEQPRHRGTGSCEAADAVTGPRRCGRTGRPSAKMDPKAARRRLAALRHGGRELRRQAPQQRPPVIPGHDLASRQSAPAFLSRAQKASASALEASGPAITR